MPSPLVEITGIFRRERVRFDDVIIGEIDEVRANGQGNDNPSQGNGNGRASAVEANKALFATPTTIKGESPPDDLQPSLTYRFYGRWVNHPKYGQQFAFQTYVRCQPHGRAGITRYLQNAPHVGKATADTLWSKFQSDAVRILREQPDVAAAAVNAPHFSQEKAAQAAEFLKLEVALESTTIDLVDLLGGRGFPKSTAKRAIQAWGNRAAEIIKRSPYNLMRFRGCGFLRADAIYLELGGAPQSLKRQAYCCWHALAKDTEGHTWHPIGFVEQELLKKIAGANVSAPAALRLAKRARAIATRRDENGRLWLADAKRAAAELRVAERVAEAFAEPFREWPLSSSPQDYETLSHHQQLVLSNAIAGGRIGVLGGSPGTGKTYSAAILIRGVVKACGERSIAVCAPTGKAAVRVTEALSSYGVPLRARTIHSLLGVAQRNDGDGGSGDGWCFNHNAGNPLPYQFIVVDESSMIDTALMASLLDARNRGAHILFIGDINQLPPVGHGAPLRDLIAAGLPYGELTEIRRNSGTIVRACAQIRDGKPFAVDAAIDLTAESPKNLKVAEATGAENQIGRLLKVLECARRDGRNPVWDCQVIVPVNAKSKLSRKDLNRLLQRELNKTGKKAAGNPFLVGDKIVCLKNSFVPGDEERNPPGIETDSDGKVFVANGELAEVLGVSEKLTVARLLAPERFVKIPRGGKAGGDSQEGGGAGGADDDGGDSAAADKADTGCNWDLGYALSCHKSQGAEWPVVVVMLDEYPGARMVCSREWVYTAISRAKALCFLVGAKATADGFCRRVALHNRKTFLRELIAEKRIEHAASQVVHCVTAKTIDEICPLDKEIDHAGQR